MKNDYNVFIPCDTAQHTCDKTQYDEASIWEKVKLSIHLIHCKACQTYTKNNHKLTKLMNENKENNLKIDERESLEALFRKELSRNDS